MEEKRISVDDVTLRWMQKEADDLDANFRIFSNYFDWVKTDLQRDVIESKFNGLREYCLELKMSQWMYQAQRSMIWRVASKSSTL